MAMDARKSAEATGLFLNAPDRPDFHQTVVEYVVRQYPQPGAEVPRDSVIYVWFDFGEGRAAEACVSPVSPGPPGEDCSANSTSPATRTSSARPDCVSSA